MSVTHSPGRISEESVLGNAVARTTAAIWRAREDQAAARARAVGLRHALEQLDGALGVCEERHLRGLKFATDVDRRRVGDALLAAHRAVGPDASRRPDGDPRPILGSHRVVDLIESIFHMEEVVLNAILPGRQSAVEADGDEAPRGDVVRLKRAPGDRGTPADTGSRRPRRAAASG